MGRASGESRLSHRQWRFGQGDWLALSNGGPGCASPIGVPLPGPELALARLAQPPAANKEGGKPETPHLARDPRGLSTSVQILSS